MKILNPQILLFLILFNAINVTPKAYGNLELPEVKVTPHKTESSRSLNWATPALSPQSPTLAEALSGLTGVESQMTCAFCGSKRLSINGHKGEHTSIFIDGLSLQSAISSFYGVDAIPTYGIGQIDVYRGAGNSGTRAESLAGAIHITTADIDYSESSATTRLTSHGDSFFELGSKKLVTQNFGVLIGAQLSHQPSWDMDQNAITEIPGQSIDTGILLTQWRPNSATKYQFRLSLGQVKIRGGHKSAQELTQAPSSLVEESDFEGQDVRNPYIGDPNKIRDQIDIYRREIALTATHQIPGQGKWEWGVGQALQMQKSIFSHGYDYDNEDKVLAANINYSVPLSSSLLVNWGGDFKSQSMQSESQVLYGNLNLKKDNLSHWSQGFYSQAAWYPTTKHEWVGSARWSSLRTSWLDLNSKVESDLISPRLAYRYNQSTVYSHLLSYGQGYRSPLSVFESQHGTDHYGFEIDLKNIEISDSITYTFIAQWGSDYLEIGASQSWIGQMAYGKDLSINQEPTLFINSTEVYKLGSFDIQYAKRFLSGNEFEFNLESFHLPPGYKRKLPAPTVETKARFDYTWKLSTSSLKTTLNWVQGRDLSAYAATPRHYNKVQEITDIFDPNYPGVFSFDQKPQQAPDFFTLDLLWSYLPTPQLTLQIGISNLLDTTQTTTFKDGPLTWDVHGNHYHLDNFHIWGPIKGRELSAKLTYLW